MKILNCNRCHKYLGEIEKGKFLKTAICLCENCNSKAKIAESMIKKDKSSDEIKKIFPWL